MRVFGDRSKAGKDWRVGGAGPGVWAAGGGFWQDVRGGRAVRRGTEVERGFNAYVEYTESANELLMAEKTSG